MNTMYLILKDFKMSLSTKKLIFKYITFRNKISIATFVFFILILTIAIFLTENMWLLIPYYASILALLVTFWKLLKSILIIKYGSTLDFQKVRYKRLHEILEKHNISSKNTALTKEKINTLISALNSIIVSKKKNIPIFGIILTIISPIIKFSLANNLAQYPKEIFLLFLLIIVIISILMMAWPIILEFLNRDTVKMEELRNMLYEILLKDV